MRYSFAIFWANGDLTETLGVPFWPLLYPTLQMRIQILIELLCPLFSQNLALSLHRSCARFDTSSWLGFLASWRVGDGGCSDYTTLLCVLAVPCQTLV